MNLDITGVTETWLHGGIRDDEIPGYTLFRQDRPSHEKRGGHYPVSVQSMGEMGKDFCPNFLQPYPFCNLRQRLAIYCVKLKHMPSKAHWLLVPNGQRMGS